jgi:DNA-binding response OmpR family regulator
MSKRARLFRLSAEAIRRRAAFRSHAKKAFDSKFVPETNVADVYMGRLRRKVDGSTDDRMIRNVRAAKASLSARLGGVVASSISKNQV